MYKSIQKGLKYFAAVLLLAYIALNVLPNNMQPAFLSQFAQNKDYSLGLDLPGGSQLDYKIDLREVEEKDHQQVLDGILKVINQRVNSLGVNEQTVYLSNVGPEKHIVVELAGIKDLEEAKSVVGKTINLVKEENLEIDPKEAELAKTKFSEIFTQVTNQPEKFEFMVIANHKQMLQKSLIKLLQVIDYQMLLKKLKTNLQRCKLVKLPKLTKN